MKGWLRIAEAAEQLHICTKTLRRWDKNGKIKCLRTPGGHRRIALADIEVILREGAEPSPQSVNTAIYARVSSHEQKQKGDLGRQIERAKEYCIQRGYPEPKVYQDVASGLNTGRKGLQQLGKMIEQGKVQRVIITYKDRLTRFGYEYLARYFASYGATIEILEQLPQNTGEQELVEDLIAIITAFSGKVHGLRSHQSKRSRQQFLSKTLPVALPI